MPHPSIDHTCAHCGASQTYRIVPEDAPDPRASVASGEIPSIDLSCQRCGAFETFKIVPASVHAASGGQ